jgi:hypothetical protein
MKQQDGMADITSRDLFLFLKWNKVTRIIKNQEKAENLPLNFLNVLKA